jgi:hypothetical protein
MVQNPQKNIKLIVTCSGVECRIVKSIKKIRRITTPGIINLVAPHLAAIDMKPPCQQVHLHQCDRHLLLYEDLQQDLFILTFNSIQ